MKLFRNTNIIVSFRTANTLKQLLTPRHNVNKYEQSGIYQLDCQIGPSKYVGQTGGPSEVRFEEHIQAIKGNKDASVFAQHILNTGHAYGCT
jgi:hypothetical protein